jgi:hypothetical protein
LKLKRLDDAPLLSQLILNLLQSDIAGVDGAAVHFKLLKQELDAAHRRCCFARPLRQRLLLACRVVCHLFQALHLVHEPGHLVHQPGAQLRRHVVAGRHAGRRRAHAAPTCRHRLLDCLDFVVLVLHLLDELLFERTHLVVRVLGALLDLVDACLDVLRILLEGLQLHLQPFHDLAPFLTIVDATHEPLDLVKELAHTLVDMAHFRLQSLLHLCPASRKKKEERRPSSSQPPNLQPPLLTPNARKS